MTGPRSSGPTRPYYRRILAAEGAALELRQIHAGYVAEAEVLRGLSISVPKGKVTSIIGANGAGKSTVLRVAFGMLPAWGGEIWLEGRQMEQWSPRRALKLGVAYVAQGRCNFPAMTVRENLAVACYTRRDKGIASDIAALMKRFPILHTRATEAAGNLSGGQQQILEIAMALTMRPKVLLLDEPTLGLSPQVFDEVFAAIADVKEEGVTVLMVEQNAARALEISDWAVVVELGQTRMESTGFDILHDPSVRENYLGSRKEPDVTL